MQQGWDKTIAKRERSARPSVIEQWIAEGRGKGVGADYNPWLHVQDVASDGRAWRIKGWKTGRDHHLFSNHERNLFLIFDWSRIVVDIREQFPLPLDITREIAKQTGIRYPTDREKNPVVLTTDFLVTLSTPTGNIDEARTFKPSSQLQAQRVIEKLEIERIYWQQENIDWGIITEREIPETLVKNIAYIHSHYDISDRLSLPQNELYDISETLTSIVAQNDMPLRVAARVCDEQLGLQRGDSLTVARHLLATRQWCVDMNIPIEPGKPLTLLSTSLQRSSDQEGREAV